MLRNIIVTTAALMLACALGSRAAADIFLPPLGGAGGAQFTARCPPNQSLVGLDLRAGDDVDAVRPICASLRSASMIEGVNAVGPMYGGPVIAATTFQKGSGGGPAPIRCPAETPIVLGVAVMAEGRQTVTVNSIALYCGMGVASQPRPQYPGALLDPPHLPTSGPFNPAGQAVFCPDGQVAAGIHGRSGVFVDALGLICDAPRNSLGATITQLAVALGRTGPSKPAAPPPPKGPGGVRAPGAIALAPGRVSAPAAVSRTAPAGQAVAVGYPSPFTVFYVVQPDGSLQWVGHAGAYAGHAGTLILARPLGPGFGQYAQLVAIGGNRLLAVRADGTARILTHLDPRNGAAQWGEEIDAGAGFDRYALITGNAFGEVYALTPAGGLFMYQAVPGGGLGQPRLVDSGRRGVRQLIAGGDGVLFEVLDDGTLLWRRHTGHFSAAPEWTAPVAIAAGWNRFPHAVSPGGGDLYFTDASGKLFYEHVTVVTSKVVGQDFTQASWVGPVAISSGWQFDTVIAAQWPR